MQQFDQATKPTSSENDEYTICDSMSRKEDMFCGRQNREGESTAMYLEQRLRWEALHAAITTK